MRFYLFSLLLLIYACSEQSSSEENPDTEALTENSEPAEVIEELPVDEVAEPIVEENVSTEYDDIDWQEYEASMTQDYAFVILISTPDYDAALERAHDASEKLGYPLNLRDLSPNEETGLTLSREVCENDICGGGVVDYPLYLPRNDYGDSKYISVEYSNGYEGYNPGYYMVIAASGEKGDPVVDEALSEARKHYEDAYAKTCAVWMGCGC